ncbi:hypothetical protein DM860_006446 [Cuscuta australis]|uniref:ATP-dependent Clp protease proteolytic subunit n=1 Tax=Cuscuta australis TaxID=267555 RepID=A0A328D4B3_9ASTE|nr:hypothetical protein DM860_006446 [Cuscuta australis]
MDSLAVLSAPLYLHRASLSTHFRRRRHGLLRHQPLKSPPFSLKCVIDSHSPTAPIPLSDFQSHGGRPLSVHLASAPRMPPMRGGDGDALGLLFKDRIVFLGNEIDDFVAEAVMSQLLLLDSQDPAKDIRLFINCPGGSLSATMAILDVVQLVRADVSTVALGISASTASLILGAGTKGKRYAMPNTRIMIHQPLGGAGGNAIDVDIQAREITNNKQNVIRIISNFTGRSLEQVEKDIDRDRYMSPIEAVEYGIIDGVIDRESIIPLEPVPDRVIATLRCSEIAKDPKSFLNPEIPDDEIY